MTKTLCHVSRSGLIRFPDPVTPSIHVQSEELPAFSKGNPVEAGELLILHVVQELADVPQLDGTHYVLRELMV